MVTSNFLSAAAVARIFWFTVMRARHGANHHGHYPPDRISRPHMGRECVGPPAVRLGQPVGNTFLYFSICVDAFRPSLFVWIGLLEMPLEGDRLVVYF
jgi:hypothetical protein